MRKKEDDVEYMCLGLVTKEPKVQVCYNVEFRTTGVEEEDVDVFEIGRVADRHSGVRCLADATATSSRSSSSSTTSTAVLETASGTSLVNSSTSPSVSVASISSSLGPALLDEYWFSRDLVRIGSGSGLVTFGGGIFDESAVLNHG